MARIKPEEIVDDLSREFQAAQEEAVREVIPGVNANGSQLFYAFKRAVRRKCSTWERVRDSHVDAD
ncbi:MAG TPA: hypothetical protein VK181_20675 [Rhizobium sp.]|nr:hypothetical protein [Rhizobium sp.]